MNRPKMEFVPKTLADLNIEGIHDLNNGRRYGSTQSLSRPRQHIPPSSSVGDLSNTDPFTAWEAPPPYRAQSRPTPGFKPHPAPRNQINGRDPWTGDFGFICWVISLVLVMDGETFMFLGNKSCVILQQLILAGNMFHKHIASKIDHNFCLP